MSDCVYCTGKRRLCTLCSPRMYGGEAEVFIKRFTDNNIAGIELSYRHGKIKDSDVMVINFCPVCGRKLNGKEVKG